MVLVAEGYGLGPRVVNFRNVGSLIYDVYGISQNCNQDDRPVNADASNGVRAVMKDLSHTCRPRGDTPR
jgi:hypothetical protein